MRITCEIIKDLLPLYHDNVCSKDSRILIGEHLLTCQNCKEELKKIDLEIEAENQMEDIKVMNSISKRWKQDKLSAFLIGSLIISIIAAIGCGIAFNIIGSYILADGTLVEPFALIPIAFMFIFIAILSSAILVTIHFVKHIKMKKK